MTRQEKGDISIQVAA